VLEKHSTVGVLQQPDTKTKCTFPSGETIAWLEGLDSKERDKPDISTYIEKRQKAMEKWRIERQTFPR
jgi:hypothetical protein